MTFNMYVNETQEKWFNDLSMPPKWMVNESLERLSVDLTRGDEIDFSAPLTGERPVKITIGMTTAQYADLKGMAIDAQVSKTRIIFTAIKLYHAEIITKGY